MFCTGLAKKGAAICAAIREQKSVKLAVWQGGSAKGCVPKSWQPSRTHCNTAALPHMGLNITGSLQRLLLAALYQ